MKHQQQSRRISTSLLASLAAILVAGGTTAWLVFNNQTPTTPDLTTSRSVITPPPPPPSPTVSPSEQSTPIAVQPPATQPTAQVYWLKDTGTSTELMPMPVAQNKGEKPDDSLKTAFNTLLAGSTNAGVGSAIPQGTKLRNVTMTEEGVYLDLSKEFTSGGGSSSMIARLAQVLYTATSADPDAKVWISVDGQRLEVLGGEGLEVPQPLTRDIFKKDYSL